MTDSPIEVNLSETINKMRREYKDVMSTIDYLAENCSECDGDFCRDQIKDYIDGLLHRGRAMYV